MDDILCRLISVVNKETSLDGESIHLEPYSFNLLLYSYYLDQYVFDFRLLGEAQEQSGGLRGVQQPYYKCYIGVLLLFSWRSTQIFSQYFSIRGTKFIQQKSINATC